jgi:hypothetical protein
MIYYSILVPSRLAAMPIILGTHTLVPIHAGSGPPSDFDFRLVTHGIQFARIQSEMPTLVRLGTLVFRTWTGIGQYERLAFMHVGRLLTVSRRGAALRSQPFPSRARWENLHDAHAHRSTQGVLGL